MSWAEDMGISAWSVDDFPNHSDNERHWKNGIHYDINDNRHKISEISDSHLINTIKYFEGLDTSPLEKEAKKRGLTLNK